MRKDLNPFQQVLYRWIQLGHNMKPGNECSLTLADVKKVDKNHPEAQAVIKSMQEYMIADLDEFSLNRHGHLGVVDGDVGPATFDLAAMPRCGYPDYGKLAIVEGEAVAVPDDAEEANWPRDCRGSLKLGRSFESLPGMSKEDVDLAFWAAANILTHCIADVEIDSVGVVDENQADIHADKSALAGSTLAWSYLAQNRCDVRLKQRYNTRVTWNFRLLVTVIVHEVIHALGGPHIRNRSGTMYPSIHAESKARHGYPHSSDQSMLKSIGYSMSNLGQPESMDIFKRPYPGDDPEDKLGPGGPTNPVPPPDPWDPPTDPKCECELEVEYVRVDGVKVVKDVRIK